MDILVLCTGNSVRSILAEAIFRRDAAGRVGVISAGTNPVGRVHPAVLAFLDRKGLPSAGLRSKGLAELLEASAPRPGVIVTLCPAAAEELLGDWPGRPATAHWPMQDPVAAPPDQLDLAIQQAFHRLTSRINALLALPFEDMQRADLAAALDRIGEML